MAVRKPPPNRRTRRHGDKIIAVGRDEKFRLENNPRYESQYVGVHGVRVIRKHQTGGD